MWNAVGDIIHSVVLCRKLVVCRHLCYISSLWESVYKLILTLIPAFISNYVHYIVWVKWFIHSQTSTVEPLNFRNWYVISYHILQDTRVGNKIELIHDSKRAPWVCGWSTRLCMSAQIDIGHTQLLPCWVHLRTHQNIIRLSTFH